jgi:hypothetical protein
MSVRSVYILLYNSQLDCDEILKVFTTKEIALAYCRRQCELVGNFSPLVEENVHISTKTWHFRNAITIESYIIVEKKLCDHFP